MNNSENFAIALKAMAEIVQEFSDNPDNPNVSAWLRGGAVDQIHKIRQEERERIRELAHEFFGREQRHTDQYLELIPLFDAMLDSK